MHKTILTLGLSLLVGCGTTTVSPSLAGKPGVSTTTNQQGYPIITSISFDRPTKSNTSTAFACLASSIDAPESAPVKIGESLSISGRGTFFSPPSNASFAFRYTLTANTGQTTSYVFNRMHYVGANGAGLPIMASKWWTPDAAYAELEAITIRVDECLARHH